MDQEVLMKKQCGKLLPIALAVSILLFFSHHEVQAQKKSQQKANPAIQMLLLSEMKQSVSPSRGSTPRTSRTWAHSASLVTGLAPERSSTAARP